MMDVGRVCVVRAGRNAGVRVVITEVIDDNFVRVVGPGIEKRMNKRHLIPTDRVLDVSGKSPEEIVGLLEAL